MGESHPRGQGWLSSSGWKSQTAPWIQLEAPGEGEAGRNNSPSGNLGEACSAFPPLSLWGSLFPSPGENRFLLSRIPGPSPVIFRLQHFSDHKLAILALGSLGAVSLFPLSRFSTSYRKGRSRLCVVILKDADQSELPSSRSDPRLPKPFLSGSSPRNQPKSCLEEPRFGLIEKKNLKTKRGER